MIKRLAAAILLALPLPAFALSNAFSYQGSLNDGGTPASGSYDLQFQLQTSAGVNVGAPLVREDVTVAAGLFSVELDFGAAITSGDFRLQIGVRPGASAGAFTTLSPTTNLRPAPQAQVAGIAAEAVTVSPNAVTGASVANGSLNGVDIDDGTLSGIDIQDGEIRTADIADGTILAIDVDTTVIQARVNNSCLAGSAIRAIGQGGAVTCETFPTGGTGTVTSVASGAGLTGGPITASGTLSIATGGVTSAMVADGTVGNADLAANAVNAGNIVDGSVGSADVNTSQVQARVSGSCSAGSSIRDISAAGAVTCETDDGSVTSVASGAGLTGGPITASGTLSIATGGVTSAMVADGTVANIDLAANAVNAGNIVDGSIGSADVNTAQVQARVSGSCAAGSSISAIAANGTVSCETDDTGPAGWSLSGNAGTNSATQFIGTTDAQALALRTRNSRSLLIDPSTTLVGGFPLSVNWLAGHSGNTTSAGVNGGTIAGGGAFAGGDLTITSEGPNSVTDSYGAVGGGFSNRAGNNNADAYDGFAATVAGGESNVASAIRASVGGGGSNTAASTGATVAGGVSNDALGTASAVAGGAANNAQGYAAMIPGGETNCAGGNYAFAAGRNAKVRIRTGGDGGSGCIGVAASGDANGDEGTFVWADAQATDFQSTGPNQFLVRADGGVMINTNALPASGDDLVLRARPGGDTDADFKMVTSSGKTGLFYLDDGGGGFYFAPQSLTLNTNRLEVGGGSNGVAFLSYGGAWSNASSRAFKTVLAEVDPLAILDRLVQLPISTWTYNGSAEGTHLGPMAEDFKAAFDLAGDGKSISTVDADGVALVAIQGLNRKLESENAALRAELAELRALVLERTRD